MKSNERRRAGESPAPPPPRPLTPSPHPPSKTVIEINSFPRATFVCKQCPRFAIGLDLRSGMKPLMSSLHRAPEVCLARALALRQRGRSGDGERAGERENICETESVSEIPEACGAKPSSTLRFPLTYSLPSFTWEYLALV